jgi:AAA+ superfamily predicted ATPase
MMHRTNMPSNYRGTSSGTRNTHAGNPLQPVPSMFNAARGTTGGSTMGASQQPMRGGAFSKPGQQGQTSYRIQSSQSSGQQQQQHQQHQQKQPYQQQQGQQQYGARSQGMPQQMRGTTRSAAANGSSMATRPSSYQASKPQASQFQQPIQQQPTQQQQSAQQARPVSTTQSAQRNVSPSSQSVRTVPSNADIATAAPAATPVAAPAAATADDEAVAPAVSTPGRGVKPAESRKASSGPQNDADPKLMERILSEVLCTNLNVTWDDVVGLEFAKQTLQETVILPVQRPDLFTGLRRAPTGVLLFGPPGTGKTMIAKALATEADATFFSISAASLVSKMLGESERLMRVLFQAARQHAPAVIFIDEIDSILSARSAGENDGIQRLKTEFFVQMDGIASQNDGLLVMGATNRPAVIDPAARRRLVKRIYVPLPEKESRIKLVEKLLGDLPHSLDDRQLDRLGDKTEGYSAFDVDALAREAAFGPVRELGVSVRDVPIEDVRPVSYRDFLAAMRVIRPSVSAESLQYYAAWDKEYGSRGMAEANTEPLDETLFDE